MSAVSTSQDTYLHTLRAQAAQTSFHPRGTVRCMGSPYFLSQEARDYGCLLDVDPHVLSWACLPFVLAYRGLLHIPAFSVKRLGVDELLDLSPTSWDVEWIGAEAERRGFRYRVIDPAEFGPDVRIANARDLLRYARWNTALGDRVRLLAALDENGSLTVAECFGAFQETPPMAGLAALILHRIVCVDLDHELIGPQTVVRRNYGDPS